ncbi:MAG: portal protein, partial [Chloroflexota bacterium]
MTQQTQALPDILRTRDQERIRGYKDLLDFYNGAQWLTQSRRERQLTFNYARVSIDKATSYLMSGLDFAVDPLGDSDRDREKAREAEAAIYQAYQQNNCEALDFETEVDAAILGDGCYKATWDPQEKRVRITAPDVQGLWAWTRGDDPSQVRRVASKYTLSAEEAKERYGVEVSGKTVDIIEDWTATAVEVWAGAERVSSGPNPYGFIPFVIFPNIREPKKLWGASDIPAIRETQRELNRALS